TWCGTLSLHDALPILEHVPDPAAVVGWLNTLLHTEGELIVHAPFHCVHQAVPTHLRSNRRYSGDWKSVYQVHGLRPNAGRVFWRSEEHTSELQSREKL